MPTRICETEFERRQLIKFIEGQKLPLTARIEHVGNRTAKQNRLNRQWMQDISAQKGDTPEYWRGYCKLHFGVAVLKQDDETFAAEYDTVIKPLPYEAKLKLMQEPFDFGITRRMTVKQQTAYLDAVHRHFSQEGIALTDPGDLLHTSREAA
jgi:hypothetical protein